jgi:DNA polymerase III delta prime subunit
MIKRIANFAATYSYDAKPKICFIDESDHMSNDVQEALRYVIEKTSDNCRYLFTANNIGKLTVAIKSRCVPISFDLMRNEVDQTIDKAVARYTERLSDIDAEIDSSRVRQICETYFPDYRSIANNFQLEI